MPPVPNSHAALVPSRPQAGPSTLSGGQGPGPVTPSPQPSASASQGRQATDVPAPGVAGARPEASQVAAAPLRELDATTILIPEVNTAIVSRGENLWTISRRIYGSGVRYTTIYGANQEQIRNPDLIYPGQTFVLPPELSALPPTR